MCMCTWGDQSCVCVLEVSSHVYVCLRWSVMCMCAWGDQSCICVLEVISHVYVCLRWSVMCMCAWGEQSCVCVLEVISHVYVCLRWSVMCVYLRWSVMCMCTWGDQSCVCVLEVISHVYVCLRWSVMCMCAWAIYFASISIIFQLTFWPVLDNVVVSVFHYIQGWIQDFKFGGAHLNKLRQAEGSVKIFGVFRVKNHDFMPKIHIFSNFRGGGGGEGVHPPWIRPWYRIHVENDTSRFFGTRWHGTRYNSTS